MTQRARGICDSIGDRGAKGGYSAHLSFSDAWIEYSFLGVHHTASVPFQSFGYAIKGITLCD
jgi:hypothetical protein